jgi:hypothetical protein
VGLFKSEVSEYESAWMVIKNHMDADFSAEDGAEIYPLILTAIRARVSSDNLGNFSKKNINILSMISIMDLKLDPNELKKYVDVSTSPEVVSNLPEIAKMLINKDPTLFFLSMPWKISGLLFNHHDLNVKLEKNSHEVLIERLFSDIIDDFFGMNGYPEPKVDKSLVMILGQIMIIFATAGALAKDY